MGAEMVLVLAIMQILLPLWLSIMAPIHAFVAMAMGPQLAMSAVALVNVCVTYFIGAILTIPAISGFKFGKIQINKVATLHDVMKSVPLVTFNACLSVVIGSLG